MDDAWTNYSSSVDAPDCGSSPIGGPTEEDGNCTVDMGLTQADTTAIADGYRETMLAAQRAVLAAGGFSWAWTEELTAPSKGAVCRAFFRNFSFLYDAPLIMTVHTADAVDELAAFLLVRGPCTRGWATDGTAASRRRRCRPRSRRTWASRSAT